MVCIHYMSKKEQRTENITNDAAAVTEVEATVSAGEESTSFTTKQQERSGSTDDFNESVKKSLDETRDNIRKSVDGVRSQIDCYADVVNNYEEQALNGIKETAEVCTEFQKQIINSFRSVWGPYVESYNSVATSWTPPRVVTEYATLARNFADNVLSTTRLTNDMIFSNMDSSRRAIFQAQDNAKQVSRISINAARTFEQAARDRAACC
jgi:hypothetical protein